MRMAIALLASVLFLPSSNSPVRIDVTPGSDLAPGAFRVRATVEPHQGNRALTISADSVKYREATTLPLEGEDAPRTHVVVFDGLPEGAYVIEVRLERNDESTYSDRRDVAVY